MKQWYVFIFVFGFTVFANASTWVFNRDIFKQRFSSEVTTEELIHILKTEGIEVRFETRRELNLWTGKHVSISLTASPFAPYHLWIAIDGRKTLDECTTEELAELYQAIWMSRKAIAKTTGANSFMIFTTEQMRNGKGSSSAGFEIIPSGFDNDGGVMDAVEKNRLNEYVFYNRFSTCNISYSPEKIFAIQKTLQNLVPVVQPEKFSGNWSQKLLHHRESRHQNLQSIHDALAQSGALIEGEMPPLVAEEEKIYEIRIDLDKCAFCNPKIIQKQLVCEWKAVYVLMNHKPISPYGDFLLLPKRHQCAWDLTCDEAIASFELIIALKKMFLEMKGSNNWICYIQDGLAVGQTVPHTHIHFSILPEHLKYAITSLQHIHNQRPILSHEEMRASCEKIKPFLLEKLQ